MENEGSEIPPVEVVFGVSSAMAEVRRVIEKASSASVPVLVTGESGTGKDLIARMFHKFAPKQDGNFVKVNCPAIPGTLLESELFGYERGAFTGAFTDKPGRVEQAHDGTLFLDEISELDFNLQAKVLQLLQDGTFMRIGGRETRQTKVRLVCATNKDLREEVKEKTFREDLYYRIAVINVRTPPLRERLEDLPVIVDYFLRSYAEKYSSKVTSVPAAVMKQMMKYHWPGNIRELQNAIRRYVIIGTVDSIISDLSTPKPADISLDVEFDGKVSLRDVTQKALKELEGKLIAKVLRANNWNRRKTAKALKISYRALLYKIQEAGLPSRSPNGKKAEVTETPSADV